MARAVFGIATSELQAEDVVSRLRAANFANDDISILFPDNQGSKDFAHRRATKAPEGAAAGGGTGAVLGGTLGWLVGIGAVSIPGVGPFIAAGPIVAALSGAAVGAGVGGLGGALIGLGIPEYEARLYEGKLGSGNILISVHTDKTEEAHNAKRILHEAGAEDISATSEARVKTENRKRASVARERTVSAEQRAP